jgi:hypothetical protein
MNLLKIEGLIIYLEKMIKEMKKRKIKIKNSKFQNNILNKIPQNQHLEKNILLIKNFLIY